MSGRCLIWSPLTVRCFRLSVVAVVEVCLHFSCPKISDRLPYQSEAGQLVLERGLVVAEPKVPFFIFLGASVNEDKVCTISFERPVNYPCAAWHGFPPKYEAWTHFNRP